MPKCLGIGAAVLIMLSAYVRSDAIAYDLQDAVLSRTFYTKTMVEG